MIESQHEQGTDGWLVDRLGVITGSQVHDAIKPGRKEGTYAATRETYINQLVAEICTGQAVKAFGAALDWGTENEDEAREAYELQNFVTVDQRSLLYGDESRRSGASPDGLVGSDGCIEIKNPYNTANHIKTITTGYIDPKYVAQMQFLMWITGRDWCHYISYDKRMIKGKLHVIRVERDQESMDKFNAEIPLLIAEIDSMLKTLGVEFGQQWGD